MRTPVWLNSLLNTWQQWTRLVPTNNPLGLSAVRPSVANPLASRALRHETPAPSINSINSINKGGQSFLPPTPPTLPATPQLNTVTPHNSPTSQRRSHVPTQSSTAFGSNYPKNHTAKTKQRRVLNAPFVPVSPIKSPLAPLLSPNVSKKGPTNDLVQPPTNTNRTRVSAINSSSAKTPKPNSYPVFWAGKKGTRANSPARELARVPMPAPPVLGSSWTNNQPLVQPPKMELALGSKKPPRAAFAPTVAQTPPRGAMGRN